MRTFTLITVNRFSQRLIGLIGKQTVDARHIFHFVPCNSVHTFGMRFPLSIVFLDDRLRLLRFIESLPPRRMAGHWRAHSVLELRAGAIQSEQDARKLVATLF